MKLNILFKILIPTTLVVIAGSIFSMSLVYRESSQDMEEIVQNETDQLVTQIAHAVEVWMGERRNEIVSLTTMDVIVHGFEHDSAKIGSTLTNTSGVSEAYEFISVANSAGLSIASTDEAQVNNLNIADRPYFNSAIKGNITISDPIKSRVTGKPIVVIAAPIKTESGKIKGVVFGSIALAKLTEKFVSPVKIGNAGYASLLSEHGIVLAHPDASIILNLDVTKYDWGKEMLTPGHGHLKYTFNTNKSSSYREIPLTHWHAITIAQTDDVLAPVIKLRNVGILAGLLTILVATAMIFWVVHHVVGITGRAISFAEAIKCGVVSGRLNSTQRDELGRLANALDAMAGSLEQREKETQIIANGDIGQKISLFSDRDALGIALDKMVGVFRHVLEDVNKMVHEVVTGSSEIASSAHSLSQSTCSQAGTIGETAELTKKAAEDIDKNTASAKETDLIATKVASDARESVDAVIKAVNFIKGIAEKISIVGEIARKTELLAINAAVEAARAGEQGRGFAVVAAEISKLAEKSQEAAAEISQFSSNGLSMGENAGRLLHNLVPNIIKTQDLVKGIASSSEQQNERVQKINLAIQSMEGTIQSNAAATEQLSATVETFTGHAQVLQKTLSFFRLNSATTARTGTSSPATYREKHDQAEDDKQGWLKNVA